ncbi:MAG: ShlB/FhaC/HecB family hemolysin secretion/activation protein [Pseudomonadota bacterium]
MIHNNKRLRVLLGELLLVLLAPQVLHAQAEAGGAPASQAPLHFDVAEFRVLGNTVLPVTAVEAAVYPYLGPQKTLEDVESARVALENAYRAAGRGTVFVDIPEQDVNEGIVRLKVTEGRLRQIRVQGARFFSGRKILAALPAADKAQVPDLPQLQRELATLNVQTADRSVVPVLGAGSVPGTVNLTLRVDDHLPLHATAELNDQYTADTSRLRATVGFSYDNLFDRLDSVGLQYQTAPEEPGELGVFVASYTRNLGAGRRLGLFFVDSDSDVAALGTLSVLGRGKVYGSRLILPFSSGTDSTHALTLGVDYKDFLENIRLDAESAFATPISYLNFSLGSSSTWNFSGHEFSISPTVNFGVRGGINTEQEFADKRFRGRPNYFYLRAGASYRTPAWHGLAVAARLAGQYTVEPVIGNEQFTIGGADSVRGYLEAEQLGDIGFSGSLQLETAALPLGFADSTLTGFLFFDAGRISVVAPLPDEPREADLSSWGAGMRFLLSRYLQGQFAWAYPLVPGSRTEIGDSRLNFMLRASW